jgi:hypothetical protein
MLAGKCFSLPCAERSGADASHSTTIRRYIMAENNAVVGIYHTHTEVEASVKELQQPGFDMQKLSIAGKDYHTEEHVIA